MCCSLTGFVCSLITLSSRVVVAVAWQGFSFFADLKNVKLNGETFEQNQRAKKVMKIKTFIYNCLLRELVLHYSAMRDAIPSDVMGVHR